MPPKKQPAGKAGKAGKGKKGKGKKGMSLQSALMMKLS